MKPMKEDLAMGKDVPDCRKVWGLHHDSELRGIVEGTLLTH